MIFSFIDVTIHKPPSKSTPYLPSTINLDSSTANTDFYKANLFNRYFYSVFHNPSEWTIIDKKWLSDMANSLHAISITTVDEYDALISLDIYKSADFDDISPKVLQSCTETLCEPFHHLFTLSLCYAIVQSSWKTYEVVPICKAGNPNTVKNYPPISLLSNTSKVLKWLIFSNYNSRLLPETQKK